MLDIWNMITAKAKDKKLISLSRYKMLLLIKKKPSFVSFLTNIRHLIPCRLITNLIIVPKSLEIVHTKNWLKSLLYFFRNNSTYLTLIGKKSHIRMASKNTTIKVIIRPARPSTLGTFGNHNAYVNAKVIMGEMWSSSCLSLCKN